MPRCTRRPTARLFLPIGARCRFAKPRIYARYPVIEDTGLLASDGYHPGIKGYRYIAEALAPELSRGIRADASPEE